MGSYGRIRTESVGYCVAIVFMNVCDALDICSAENFTEVGQLMS